MVKTHSISSALLQRLETLLAEMEERKQECLTNGHKYIDWEKYLPNNQSSYSDKINGRCNYCGDNLERSLNEQERKQLEDYLQLFNKSINI